MKKILTILFTASLMFMISCDKGEGSQNVSLSPLDLGAQGIPVSIKAPADAEVENYTIALEKGITVKKENFNVVVEMYEEYADPSGDPAAIKAETLEDEQAEDDFVRVVLDEENGFVWETNDPDVGKDFHFFYVTFKDGKQIEFSEGLSLFKNFSEEDVMLMYKAVKQ
jgi:hypothetical protein